MSTAEPPVIPLDPQELGGLIEYLRDCPGRISAAAVPHSAAGNLLIDRLRVALEGVEVEELGQRVLPSPVELGRITEAKADVAVVLVLRLDRHASRESRLEYFTGLNYQRERLAPGQVRTLLVMTHDQVGMFGPGADDLWDWTLRFRFGDPMPTSTSPAGARGEHHDGEREATVSDLANAADQLRRARSAGLDEAIISNDYVRPYLNTLIKTRYIADRGHIWDKEIRKGVPLGAMVLRLQTRAGATVPGHALLIGSPLDGLQGVDMCLQRVSAWLGPEYEIVESPLSLTKANIEAAVLRLLDTVVYGEQVLLYYAGHGKQWIPDSEQHDGPVTVLVPIDARFESSAHSRLISGYELVGWLEELAHRCGAVRPGHSVRSGGPEPSVTVMLECCHAAGLLGWPDEEDQRVALETAIGHAARTRRHGIDGISQILWVMATGRDEVAQGLSSGDVGLMTLALVDLLEQHPEEPWWAIWDRMLAVWTEPTQHPELVGPMDMVPRIGRRHARPSGMIPCQRIGPTSWRGPLLGLMEWKPKQQVVLNASLSGPEQAWGEIERIEETGVLSVYVPEKSAISDQTFAWMTRLVPGRVAIIDVWGSPAVTRAKVVQRLSTLVERVRDRESKEHPAVALRFDPRRLPLHLHHPVGFEVNGDTVVIYDRWGDQVARTGLDEVEVWTAWLDRLTTLDDWLELQQATDWPEDGFSLRWGSYDGGERTTWDDRPPAVLTPQTSLWVEVEARIHCTPAYVSVFRIRADRAVEALTKHAPNGLPVTARYPVARLGSEDEPLRLVGPDPAGERPRWEQLVVLVSGRPLPVVALEQGPIGRAIWPAHRGDQRPRLGMQLRGYRIRL